MTEPDRGWTSPGSGPTPPPSPAGPPAGYDASAGYGYGGAESGGYGAGYGSGGGYGGGPPIPARPWAPTPGVVPLRPLGLGELLDGAIKIIRRYPKPTLGMSAVIAVVVTILNVLFVLTLDTDLSLTAESDGTSAQLNDALASNASAVPGGLVSYLAGVVLTGMLVAVVGRAVLGQAATMGEVWTAVRPRLLPLLGLSLLSGLLIVAPIALGVLAIVLAGPFGVLVLLPGIAATVYLYVRLSLSAAALVLEKTGVVVALRRSGVLVRGSWWRVCGILIVTFIIGAVLSGIFTFPVLAAVGIASFRSGDTTALLVATQVASGLASIVVAPFSAGVAALLYVDQRMRKEGLDVALQAAAAAPPAR